MLNIYPTQIYGGGSTITNTITFVSSADGKQYTLPKSASLKQWMEEATPEAPLGYGQGIIKVDAVDINTFNANANTWCDKNKYDVIFFGSWDYNGGAGFTHDSIKHIESWIKSGKGFVSGHDSFTGITCQNSSSFNSVELNKLSWKYFAIKSGADLLTDPPNLNYAATATTSVVLKEKGLLTNYPWEIGQPGNTLTIPLTHAQSTLSYGKNWLNLSTYDDYSPYNDGSVGNYYLVTNNNTAHVQTGHSNGAATTDEQKILANLLFYMNQLLFNTSTLRDASAQDTTAPAILSHEIKPDNQHAITLTSEDYGNAYSYYVESYTKDDTTETGHLHTSQTEDVTVTTGVKEYRYLFDDSPDTKIYSTEG